MSSYLESKSHPSERQQAASLLQLLGWSGFWIQFVLTIVSGLILGFAILSPNLNLNLKSGIGLLSVIGGIEALALSIYWFFRYVHLGRMALRKDTALALTGSQPPGWEPILGGSASSSLTRGSSPLNTFPAWRLGTR
ncbi:MAG: DUF3611 family protein [Nostoc sp.]|uniref:DUF3611 family protein n=1 Tax=Nostoc sp. TaxID=1180 RepID=UPI002FF929A5